MAKQISEQRKLAYYIGLTLMAIGFLSFMSTFFSAASHFGDFSNFEERGKSMAFRAFGGMFLMMVGGGVAIIGSRGLAGSGIVLDPEKAREDVEPFSRMTGGIIKDALDEADIHLGGSTPEKVIMIKCPACGELSNEKANFCQACGHKFS